MNSMVHPMQESPATLRGRTVLLAAVVALAAGAAVAWIPAVMLVLALCPILLYLVLRFPEPLIAMFLTSGLLKQDPVIGALIPFDLTVLLAAALALAILVKALRQGMYIPKALWALAPFLVAVALGVVLAPNAYGAEKALRFTTLTGLAVLAPLALLDTRARLSRFLVVLALVGVWASISAARTQEATQWGRLTAGGNPIPLGRAGALAFAFAWLRLHFAKQPFDRAAAVLIMGISAFSVMSSGSRGPVLSVVLAMILISLVTYRHHKRAPIGLGTLLFVGVLGTLAISFVTIPEAALRRFEILFSGEGGSSILMRGFLYATAWQLTLRHPLGIGVGGFESHAPLDLRYPHNLFLEVGCELGWIPLVSLFLVVVWSVVTIVRIVRREYAWQPLFVGLLVITTLLNAMVSGDLNDNRPFFAALLMPFLVERLQRKSS